MTNCRASINEMAGRSRFAEQREWERNEEGGRAQTETESQSEQNRDEQ